MWILLLLQLNFLLKLFGEVLEYFQLFVPMAEKLGLVAMAKELKALSLEVMSKK